MSNRITRSFGTGLIVAGLTLGAVACSDDDGDGTDIDNPVDGVDDAVDKGAEEIENQIDSETNDGMEDDSGGTATSDG